ncbi:glucose sorbosone dehydrogenase [Hyphomicrobium methylovorum]|uniref:PQQ-dependent sugar dehydrogenase n=1 Tax=Hyphomicrobium methylovorum TaxID=84 RepID=UPI0015E6E464|nr:PQQ-dependent sugar dehydrogenase [Hyphomicrobium methylovorum]MBA2127503.1 glucose sorbosone dehydrogenase [Hyphomicrobium methylovorum]
MVGGRGNWVGSGIAAAFLSGLILASAGFAHAEVVIGEPRAGPTASNPELQYVPDEEFPYELRKVSGPLESPWSIAFLPDGRILVTERPGRLRVIENDQLLPQAISGVPQVTAGGHSGLLDIVVDKDFSTNQRIFMSYMAGPAENLTMRIVRARLDGMNLVDKQVIFESEPPIKGTDQIGGRLALGADGHVYLTIGDRWEQDRAQNLMDDAGKIIRITVDGGIPEDNPFVGRSDVRPEVYSYGHRNPQGLITNAGDGRMWSIEQGPKGGDELNIIKPGANYGWPVATFGVNYDGTIISNQTSAPDMVDPVHYWVPSMATASLVAYSGDVMPDDWRGNLLIGTLVGQSLIRLEIEDGIVVNEKRYLHDKIGRIRDVAVSENGFIYLLSDGSEATLYRLEPITDEVARARITP